jgi:hypothetical protein
MKGPYGDTCNTIDKVKDDPGSSFEGTEMQVKVADLEKKR